MQPQQPLALWLAVQAKVDRLRIETNLAFTIDENRVGVDHEFLHLQDAILSALAAISCIERPLPASTRRACSRPSSAGCAYGDQAIQRTTSACRAARCSAFISRCVW